MYDVLQIHSPKQFCVVTLFPRSSEIDDQIGRCNSTFRFQASESLKKRARVALLEVKQTGVQEPQRFVAAGWTLSDQIREVRFVVSVRQQHTFFLLQSRISLQVHRYRRGRRKEKQGSVLDGPGLNPSIHSPDHWIFGVFVLSHRISEVEDPWAAGEDVQKVADQNRRANGKCSENNIDPFSVDREQAHWDR